ncbi:MAG: FliM/FliN family flagellar motor switch protein [Acidobacteria bacterium]|nr:FliM/FliN family flagellar motor switch protein [Acidobacteriota bacterium]
MAQPESQAEAAAGDVSPQRSVPETSALRRQESLVYSPPANDRDQFRSFLDLPIQVSVQMGRKLVKFREVLDLEVDSVIRMNKSAGENVDLLLENLTVGRGEIIVIEDMMGLRITDLTQDEADHETQEADEA